MRLFLRQNWPENLLVHNMMKDWPIKKCRHVNQWHDQLYTLYISNVKMIYRRIYNMLEETFSQKYCANILAILQNGSTVLLIIQSVYTCRVTLQTDQNQWQTLIYLQIDWMSLIVFYIVHNFNLFIQHWLPEAIWCITTLILEMNII